MPGQRLIKQHRRLQAVAAALLGAGEIVRQHGLEGRMGAVLDDDLGALLRAETAQVGQALFGHDDLHVLRDMVHVAHVRHDRRDLSALGGGRRDEHRDEGIAGEVAGAADAVLDARTHDVGGVDVAVDVCLDQAVHRQTAQTADHLRMVADLLRAQDNPAPIVRHLVVQPRGCLGAQRKGGGGGHAQLAAVEQIEHAVLQDLGIGGHVLERAVLEAEHHCVGDIADARLQRQQVRRQTAPLHFMLEEFDDVPGDGARGLIRRGEGRVAIRDIGLDNGDDLGRIHPEAGAADAVVSLHDGNRHTVGRQRRAVVDVVHPLQRLALPRVHFKNDLVGAFQPGLVVTDRR